ncbi:hypothetical protein BH11PSE3_BH11PSE3_42790 [soil metagenome]
MSDARRAQGPSPVLRTRPATMLTALGLCVVVMIMQFMPEVRDGGPGRLTNAATAAR